MEYTKDSIKVEVLLSNQTIINGYINIIGYDRFSDFINKDYNRFIMIYNAVKCGKGGSNIMVNKDNIVYIIPKEDPVC